MFKLSRLLVAYAIAVPLAVLLGFLVTSFSSVTFAVIGTVLFVLALPLLLRWYHVLLVVFWNSCFIFFFLPGHPDFWLLFALLGFAISMLNHIMFQKPFLRVPELSRPLLLLTAVVVFTAEYRGGVGIRAFGGSSFGGRYYVFILGAIAGYFAFASEAIPFQKGRKMSNLFFFSGTTFALSNIIFLMGPFFYFLYAFVPAGGAQSQANSEAGLTQLERLGGLSSASVMTLSFLLTYYGVRGLFDIGKPWRLLFLGLTIAAAFFGGFRSTLVMLFVIFALAFYFEGLLHTHYFPIVAGLAICGLAPILIFARFMPPAVQRAVSFLPVNVDSSVLADAKASTEWRFQMWREVAKEIPQYLLIGKGYAINPEDFYAVIQAERMGYETSAFEGTMMAGDYHSGPLSVIIPFGLFGVIAFLWVLYGGYRVLSLNFRHGDARLRRANGVLLALYITYCLFFFFVFGALNTEFCIFTGLCGMSVSLNGGVKRKAAPLPAPVPAVQSTPVMEPG
jgi:hypothetical protein